jgi:hypothetical protein
MKTLITAAISLAPMAAQAHPGHGLENILAHTLHHGSDMLFVVAAATSLGAYLVVRARR